MSNAIQLSKAIPSPVTSRFWPMLETKYMNALTQARRGGVLRFDDVSWNASRRDHCESYLKSARHIASLAGQCDALFNQIAEATILLPAGVSDAARSQWLQWAREILIAEVPRCRRVDVKLGADLLKASTSERYRAMRATLLEALAIQASYICDAFAELHSRGLIGLLNADADDETIVEIDFRKAFCVERMVSTDRRDRLEERPRHGLFRLWRVTEEITTHEHALVFERHTHRLFDVTQHRVFGMHGDRPRVWQSALPARVVGLVQHIPPTFRPAVRVLDGVQYDAEIQRSVVRTEFRQQIKTVSETLLPSQRLAADPCLIIGQFVIAGWDQSEVDQNLGRSTDHASD